jgi:hypothetical protein
VPVSFTAFLVPPSSLVLVTLSAPGRGGHDMGDMNTCAFCLPNPLSPGCVADEDEPLRWNLEGRGFKESPFDDGPPPQKLDPSALLHPTLLR